MAWLGSVFILKKEATIPIFHFKKEKTKTKKEFLNKEMCGRSFHCILTLILSV